MTVCFVQIGSACKKIAAHGAPRRVTDLSGLRTAPRPAKRPRCPTRIGRVAGCGWTRQTRCCAHSDRKADDFGGWSIDFVNLCRAQFELLASTLNIVQCALFFRRENSATGALEFVPLVTYPRHERDFPVWISVTSEEGGKEVVHTPSLMSRLVRRGSEGHPELPGGFPAAALLPGYPFVSMAEGSTTVMQDGGLCIPIVYGQVVAGLLTLWRAMDNAEWREKDKRRASAVARTIALAATLEGRWQNQMRENGEKSDTILTIGKIIDTAVHQASSPITALLVFGKLLLKKLPPGDTSRELAKSIIVASQRLGRILLPLNDSSTLYNLGQVRQYTLPPGSSPKKDAQTALEDQQDPPSSSSDFDESGKQSQQKASSSYSASEPGKQLVWISDALTPIFESSKVLANEKGIEFTWYVNEESPPVVASESDLCEAVSNLIDNALKFTPAGGSVSAQIDTWGEFVEVAISDTGPGIGPEEQDLVLRAGFRGKNSADVPGSGLGLAIVQQFVSSVGGELSIDSPSELNSPDPKAFPGTSVCLGIPRAHMQQ